MGPLPSEGGFFPVHGWLAADLVCPCPAAFGELAVGCQIIWIRADDLGPGWVGRKRAGRISWDGFPPPHPPRSIKTRSQDCAGSLGNSSACWRWQRGPWHLLHPGSLVRGEHVAPGKAELHSHLYFELRGFISVRGKTTTI